GAAHVVGGAAAAPAPECVPVRGVLHEEDVLAALAREREGAEGGGPREAADEVDVAAVYGDGVGALAACAPPPVSPEHVALGRVLHEEDVVVAGTGQGDVPERGRVPEAAADVGGAVGVYGDAVADVVVRPAAVTGPDHVTLGRVLHGEDVSAAGADEGGVAERGRVEEEPGGVGGAVGADGEAEALVVLGAAGAADPAEGALGGVPRGGEVPGVGAAGGGVAERGRLLEPAGDVDVAGGVDGEAVADVVADAAAAAGPEHVALGRELHEVELLVGAGAGERERAEGDRAGEVAGDVDVAGGVDGHAVALVGGGTAAPEHPQPILGLNGEPGGEEHRQRGEAERGGRSHAFVCLMAKGGQTGYRTRARRRAAVKASPVTRTT